MKNRPEEIESNPTVFRPSAAMATLMKQLTPKQQAAIPRLVKQHLAGLPREELFKGPDRICHRSVFMENWKKNPVFNAALELALSDANTETMRTVVTDTVDRLRQIAPLAADDLERQITGDAHALAVLMRVASNGKRPTDERVATIYSMAAIGTRDATDRLLLLIDDADPMIRKTAAEAVGKCASGLDSQRRMADVAVLDRAAPETASKAGDGDEIDLDAIATKRWAQVAPLLQQLEAQDAATDAPAEVPG